MLPLSAGGEDGFPRAAEAADLSVSVSANKADGTEIKERV